MTGDPPPNVNYLHVGCSDSSTDNSWNETVTWPSVTGGSTTWLVESTGDCFICKGKMYYKDDNGQWHNCPRCNPPYVSVPVVESVPVPYYPNPVYPVYPYPRTDKPIITYTTSSCKNFT
jgi:hypothetical protein